MKALSIRQPWAHLIINGVKCIENRLWRTDYRGPLLIHAGLRCEPIDEIERQHDLAIHRDLQLGGIIGTVDLVRIVTKSDDPFFTGPFGWVLANPRPLPFRPLAGRLKLFDVEV